MTDIHNHFQRIRRWMTDGNQGGELGRWMKVLWRKFRGTGILKGLIIVTISSIVTLWIRYSSGETKIWYEILLNDADAISLTTVGIIFILESSERKKRSHYEAWQVIDNAASGSIKVSFARKQALEDLCRDGVSLAGIDLRNADLRGINLQNADLEGADLGGANLENASFIKANLKRAKFKSATEHVLYRGHAAGHVVTKIPTMSANLQGTDFSGADLSYSVLEGVVFTGAKLENAVFYKADLSRTTLSNDQLFEANFYEARLPDDLANLI